jgi:competence protein ComGD
LPNRHRASSICRRNRKDGGFTLIEILVVLAVFILIFSLASGLFPHFLKNQETEQFFRQFSDDIHYAQAYAISHQQYIEVLIEQSPGKPSEKYHISNVMKGMLYERQIPKDILFTPGSMKLRVLYAPNGNITSAGVWYVKSGEDSYKITFNIGKGRFRIEKILWIYLC